MSDILLRTDHLRQRFSAALSKMYRIEAPATGGLTAQADDVSSALSGVLVRGQSDRIGEERHAVLHPRLLHEEWAADREIVQLDWFIGKPLDQLSGNIYCDLYISYPPKALLNALQSVTSPAGPRAVRFS